MSIKLLDNYTNGGLTNYGTILEIYGLYAHQTSQLYFGGWDNYKIRYREAFYGQNTWNDWITMLDSKNDVESSGNLKLTGNANSYILNGNLGVGTNTPNNKLDVNGKAHIYNFPLIVGNDFPSDQPYRFAMFYDNTMSGNSKYINFGKNNTIYNCGELAFNHVSDNSSENFISFGVYGKGAMYIKADDRIGIGNSSPKNALDVNGTIHSKEVKVDMTGWSDFVFKKEYNLPTLEEVEKHIKENGHLENIPSEKEVLENGINLGEMNAKLLQKIEELTLYMIEQERKNQNQSDEINFLKKENQLFQSLLKRVEKLENTSK
ncbi:hypothetical protein FEM21_22260 [Flavobacterium seoulense]|uniref:Uncharacterized protein n=2 Tax=Flavobacterium seoulense TaxID=1492738 RepID=A0A066WL19_9FLAO|nr:hypothetical protein FEM21_22260 [Flavobacterium seoulense]